MHRPRRPSRRQQSRRRSVVVGHVVAHAPPPAIAAVTGIIERTARVVTSASKSSGNRVIAEWIGTYADGPTKQIVVILYGNGTRLEPEPLARGVRHVARADRLADLTDRVEIGIGAFAGDDALDDAVQPRATLAARHALAARLVRVELHERERRRRDVGRVVHHHHRARTEHRSGLDSAACPRTGCRVGRRGTTAPIRRRARTS